MTVNEIANLLGYPYEIINRCIVKAGKQEGLIANNLKEKKGKSTKLKMVDYTFEEVDFAMQFLCRYTEAQRVFLRENFIQREECYLYKSKKKSIYANEARKFTDFMKAVYKKHKSFKHFRCCANCGYITARRMNRAGCKDSPYCNFYSCFLNKSLPKRNIYKDFCTSFTFSDAGQVAFTRDGILVTDILGAEERKTLGIENSRFTTGRTPKDQPIILLRKC